MGGGILDTVLFQQQQVKVPAAVVNGFGFLERTIRNSGKGHTWRHGEAFLRGCQHEIQTPGIGFNFNAAH